MKSGHILGTFAALALLGAACSSDSTGGGTGSTSSTAGSTSASSTAAGGASSIPTSSAVGGASGGASSSAGKDTSSAGKGGSGGSVVVSSGGGGDDKSSSVGAGSSGNAGRTAGTTSTSLPVGGSSTGDPAGGTTAKPGGTTGSTAKGGSGGSTSTGTAGSTGTSDDPHAPGNPPVKTAGCGKTPTLKTGPQKITSSGTQRDYIIDIPADYDNTKPYRLIFGLHWMGGTMTDVATGQTVKKDVWAYFGLKRLDTPRSAIFVAPQGIGNGWANTNGQDTTLLDDIIKTVSEDLCIDKTRIFAGGFSYGGMFSSTLACTRTDTFRALAPQNGSASCASPKKVAFICSGSNDGSKTSLLSYARGIAKVNGCANPNEDMPQPAAGSKLHNCTSFSGCPASYPVRYCAFDANHKAAPCDGCGPEQDNGDTTWTPAEVWKFYTQF